MHKKILIILFFLFWTVPASEILSQAEVFAQVDTAWVRRYNGPGNDNDRAYAIAVDGSGNVYVTGYNGSSPNSDYATIKYYPNGDTAWVRGYNGPGNFLDMAYAIAIDGSDNVYVTGNSFDGWADCATIKYYPNGDTAWVRRYNGPENLGDWANAIAVDGSANVYVTGSSYGDETGYDYVTIKYYADGDTAWVRRYNGPGNEYDEANAIALDDSGNVYVTGFSCGSGTDYDYATIKYYPDGDTAWVRGYNGPGNSGDAASAIAVDSSGDVYVTGYSMGSETDQDYATIKYYPNGDMAWVKRYSGPGDQYGNSYDEASAIALDGFGNVYVTGICEFPWSLEYITIKYYPDGDTAWVRNYHGLSGVYLTPAIAIDGYDNVCVTGGDFGLGTSLDYATAKYYPNGDTAWVRRYNGPGNDFDYADDITVDRSGNVYVTGRSYGSETDYDYVTIKYIDLSAPPEIWELCSNKGPNMNGVYISITGSKFDTLASVKLFRSGVPDDSIIGSDVGVLSYNTKIICRFDLAGQPIGSIWDLIVTNPNWKADTLFSALTIVSPFELSTKDVLCVLSANHERIQDFQANAKAWSKFNGEPLDSIIHSVSLYKAPDKVKNIDYDNEDTTQVISTVINRGYLQYEIDPETGDAYETNLLQVAQMTPSEFAGLNFYDPDNFLFHHYVTIKEIHEYPDSLIFVVEAIPKRAEWTYSKLELEIDYSRGLVVNSIVYSDTVGQQTVTVTEEQLIDGIWIGTKSINIIADTSETLQTEIELSNIQINVGIPDSIFEVNVGKLGPEGGVPESTFQELQQLIPPKHVSVEWEDPKAYKPNPIIFLHGAAKGNPNSWKTLADDLNVHFEPYYEATDWYLYRADFTGYPGVNASIDCINVSPPDRCWATVCSTAVEDMLQHFTDGSIPEGYYPTELNLVCHSTGGLTAREYVTNSRYGNSFDKVEKIVTVGTPHLGMELADRAPVVAVLGRITCTLMALLPKPRLAKVGRLGIHLLPIAEWLLEFDPFGELAEDLKTNCQTNLFFHNLYSRDQQESKVKYYAIAGVWGEGLSVIVGEDDLVVSKNSQRGYLMGEPGCSNRFYEILDGKAIIEAIHIHETDLSRFRVKKFLDQQPNIVITQPQDNDSIAEACTLRIELHNEYLPATTILNVDMTRLGESEPIFTDVGWRFKPDTSWRAEGPNPIKSGRYDTTIIVSKAPPGKYVITARATNPATFTDETSVTITLGVDLMTDIGGGQARRNMNKTYGIGYSNIGSAKASNVTLEAVMDPRVDYVSSSPPGDVFGNTVSWDFDSLAAGESGNVSVTVFIPWSVDQGEILQASSNITTTDEDVDLSNNTAEDPEEVVGSYDPNDKVVYPTGVGARGYIKEGQRLRYTVYFENDSSATAEAIDIVVVDTLDPNLNWNSLRIGPMSHPDKCSGSFDPVTGVITWECDSIMLPPNDNPPEGEGWFTFAILPQYLQHGTEIKNRASIQFDNNPWIYAPEDSSFIVNTMDEYPPNSRVTALWDTVGSSHFEVNWRGSDDSLGFGSGIRDYTIYVSDEGGPYEIWIADTSDTFATFHGEQAHTYCFYSIAEDSVGNIEDAPLTPDACTRTPTYIRGDANADGVINIADVVYLVNHLFIDGPAPDPLEAGDANCDEVVNIADVVYLVNYLFIGGPPPGC